jgi:hypothetical protein
MQCKAVILEADNGEGRPQVGSWGRYKLVKQENSSVVIAKGCHCFSIYRLHGCSRLLVSAGSWAIPSAAMQRSPLFTRSQIIFTAKTSHKRLERATDHHCRPEIAVCTGPSAASQIGSAYSPLTLSPSYLIVQYTLPQPRHQIVHILYIVYRRQCHCNRLVSLEQVTQIGSVIVTTSTALALCINRHAK